MRPAHAAEMGDLRRIVRQRGIVVRAGRLRIERKVELVFPTEFKPGLRQGVVPGLRAGMAFGEVRRMRGNLIGDDTDLHVFFGRQSQMFLRRHIAEHGAAVPPDHRGADTGGDVVVPRRDIGG